MSGISPSVNSTVDGSKSAGEGVPLERPAAGARRGFQRATKSLVEVGEPLGHGGDELLGDLGDLGEQARELPLADDLDGHRGLRNDGGGPGTVVEEGDLAHVGARTSGGDHTVTLADLDLAVEHDDELVAGRAFAHEDGPRRLLERRRELRDELQLLLRQPLEQRHLGQLLLDPIVTVHRGSSSTRGRSPADRDTRSAAVRSSAHQCTAVCPK